MGVGVRVVKEMMALLLFRKKVYTVYILLSFSARLCILWPLDVPGTVWFCGSVGKREAFSLSQSHM